MEAVELWRLLRTMRLVHIDETSYDTCDQMLILIPRLPAAILGTNFIEEFPRTLQSTMVMYYRYRRWD